jgi:nucleoside-diphosphate-sugar epimerase
MNKKRLIITGANGFIGSHLMKHLESLKDYEIFGLVRRTSNLFRLQNGDHRLIEGSLDDLQDGFPKDIDCVIHTAGLASDWGKWEDFYRTNVEGTLKLIRTSIARGVKRFIYLSSTVVYGFTGNLNTGEDQKLKPFHHVYCESKYLAETKVFEHKKEIEIFILRPSNVFGPYDTRFTMPLIEGINRGLKFFPGGGKKITSPCYVKNLVNAVELCIKAEKGSGEAYNITDGNDITWKEFLSMVAEELGKKPPKIHVPPLPLYILSMILEKLYTMLGSSNPPLLTPYRIAQVSNHYSFSIDKAKALLNYNPPFTTLEGILDSVKWYRESCL